MIYDNSSYRTGILAPDRVISGDATGLDLRGTNTFNSLFVDQESDKLYVCNFGSIEVFDSASTANGNVAPSQCITGSNTQLVGANGIYLRNNRIYVGSIRNVLVFVVSDTGNIAPTATFEAATSEVVENTITALYVSPSDTLYATSLTFEVRVFNNAYTQSGSPAPDRLIETPYVHAFTKLLALNIVESPDLMFTVSQFSPIEVIYSPSTLSGPANPTYTNNYLTYPLVIAYNARTDVVFETDSNDSSIFMWDNGATLHSGAAARRIIAPYGLNFQGMAIDPFR